MKTGGPLILESCKEVCHRWMDVSFLQKNPLTSTHFSGISSVIISLIITIIFHMHSQALKTQESTGVWLERAFGFLFTVSEVDIYFHNDNSVGNATQFHPPPYTNLQHKL